MTRCKKLKIGDRQRRPRANHAWDAVACPRFLAIAVSVSESQLRNVSS